MSQVVRTTNDLIVHALYLMGELGVGETPDAFMLSTGIELLNEQLDKLSADGIYIPYITTIRHQFIAGKSTYSISDILLGVDITSARLVDLIDVSYDYPNIGPSQRSPITFEFIADPSTDYLAISDASSFPTGTPIVVTTFGTVPSPLFAGTTYYAIYIDATHIKMASSEQNALSGIAIDILTAGIPINTITAYAGDLTTSSTSITYPITLITDEMYWSSVRQNGLSSLPRYVYLNKQADESLITFFPSPDKAYAFTLRVKLMLTKLGPQDVLSNLPPNYYGFLKRALARGFISYYPSGNWSEIQEKEYTEYYSTLKMTNPIDVSIQSSSRLRTGPAWTNILSY